MSEDIWLDVMGLSAKVSLDDEELAAETRRAWSACLIEPPDAEPDIAIEPESVVEQTTEADPEPVVEQRAERAISRDHTLAADLEQLTQTITVTAIEALAGRRLMLHACAVADEQTGRCVVLVGPSGMGKTTVASTFGRRWAYVTDECVAIDDGGLVTPFPKPLSVIAAGAAKTQQAPHELDLTSAARPTRPTGLLLLRRDPGASDPVLDQVSPVQAVALLAEHASYLAHLDRPLKQLADLVHAAGGLQVVTYAEAAHLAPVVEELLGSTA